MTRTGSSDGSSVSMPIGRSKSSSASSVTSQGVKIKATTPPSSGKSSSGSIVPPSVNLRQGGSPDARGKPPVPKNDITTAATPKCIVAAKYVNKDFRKSTLNMENGDPLRSKYARRKKNQRTISVSSQDSETASKQVLQAASSSLKSNRSRLRTPSGGSKPMMGRSSSNGSIRWEQSGNESKSSCGTKKRPSGTFSSSSSSSQSTSANSSSSEDDDDRADRPGSRRRKKHASESPTREMRGKISGGSSRTSVLASSTDEIMTEKPPRPPSSPRSKGDRSVKTEEAKSFLMRALAPVTNFFKSKSQDSGDTSKSGGWIDSNDENFEGNSNKSGQPLSSSRSISQNFSRSPGFTNSERSDGMKNTMRIQSQYSGEKPWWLDSNSDNIPDGVERASPWNDDGSQDTTISTVLPDDGKHTSILLL